MELLKAILSFTGGSLSAHMLGVAAWALIIYLVHAFVEWAQ